MASPAEILRVILINAGVVIMPAEDNQLIPYEQTPGDGSTTCYVSSMPDDDDQCVGIFDTSGLLFGRSLRSQTLIHPGVKIMIRALDYQTGDNLGNAIAAAMDAFTRSSVETPDETLHYVQSVYRTSTINHLGEEVGKKRQLWSMSARIAFQIQEPTLG